MRSLLQIMCMREAEGMHALWWSWRISKVWGRPLAETCFCAGRFGFVELRTDELATSATALDKVELCGRHINVGRPKVRCSCAKRAVCVLHPNLLLVLIDAGAS